jgi:anti-sigma factor RsiW
MTHSDYTGPLGAHGECWNLLPWIANESAAAKDAARVEAHLRGCRECQEELEFQRQLRNAIRSEEAVVLAPQTSLQKLMQRIDTVEDIDDEPQAPPAEVVAMPRREPARWSRWLPIAAAIQGIVITGLLAALWMQSSDTLTDARYTMLLTPEKPVAHGQVIRVVFSGGVALDDMNRVLRSIDAQVIAGPSKADVYTLGLTAGADDQLEVDKALAQLRADSHVRFAELVVTSEAP